LWLTAPPPPLCAQADGRVAFFFDGINMTAQKNKQKLFLTMILDGPHE